MQINTTRFGMVDILPEDILLFSRGLIGFEEQRHWVLLADESNDAVAWLQSLSDESVALPVTSPRRFAPGYRVHITANQLTPLELAVLDHTYVLVVVSHDQCSLTVDLRAPVVVNLDRRIGRQLITCTADPVQMVVSRESAALRKSA